MNWIGIDISKEIGFGCVCDDALTLLIESLSSNDAFQCAT